MKRKKDNPLMDWFKYGSNILFISNTYKNRYSDAIDGFN